MSNVHVLFLPKENASAKSLSGCCGGGGGRGISEKSLDGDKFWAGGSSHSVLLYEHDPAAK